VPFCQQSQTARTALTYSRIHGAAGVQGMPKRRSIWAFTCVPRPKVKWPRDSFCSVHAVTVGLRGKAIATDVPSFWVRVVWAASANRMNGSYLFPRPQVHRSRSLSPGAPRRRWSGDRVAFRARAGRRRPCLVAEVFQAARRHSTMNHTNAPGQAVARRPDRLATATGRPLGHDHHDPQRRQPDRRACTEAAPTTTRGSA